MSERNDSACFFCTNQTLKSVKRLEEVFFRSGNFPDYFRSTLFRGASSRQPDESSLQVSPRHTGTSVARFAPPIYCGTFPSRCTVILYLVPPFSGPPRTVHGRKFCREWSPPDSVRQSFTSCCHQLLNTNRALPFGTVCDKVCYSVKFATTVTS